MHSIGTLLVEKTAKIAKAKKMSALSVHTWETNEKMLNFSAKKGFQVLERVKDFYGRGKDALRLKREIPP